MDSKVGKLLKASFIKEVKYTKWLTNVVSVNKASGQ